MVQAKDSNGRRAYKLTDEQRLLSLFQAFRDQDETAFFRAAEAIIDEQLAANHHQLASELRRALGLKSKMAQRQEKNGLKPLPRDRRSGEPLIHLQTPSERASQLLLSKSNRDQVERAVEEREMRAKLARFGYQPKSRLLFWGPPGCGKTLAAHAIAERFNLPVGVVQLSALISSFLGDTATHVSRVFHQAESMPMVLLLDEFDAIGKDRDDSHDVGELKRVVNTLLQSLDAFSSGESLLVAASNHQYMLDPAVWRRFDDVIFFPKPGPSEREEFLKRLLNGVKFKGTLVALGKRTSGLSFADIERIVVDSIKTMILADEKTLSPSVINRQLKLHREAVIEAQGRRNGC